MTVLVYMKCGGINRTMRVAREAMSAGVEYDLKFIFVLLMRLRRRSEAIKNTKSKTFVSDAHCLRY